MRWLAMSLVVSVVLTVALNLALRAWPGAGRRADGVVRTLDDWATRRAPASGSRVVVPWKGMLIASLGLTLALNVLIRVL